MKPTSQKTVFHHSILIFREERTAQKTARNIAPEGVSAFKEYPRRLKFRQDNEVFQPTALLRMCFSTKTGFKPVGNQIKINQRLEKNEGGQENEL